MSHPNRQQQQGRQGGPAATNTNSFFTLDDEAVSASTGCRVFLCVPEWCTVCGTLLTTQVPELQLPFKHACVQQQQQHPTATTTSTRGCERL